jgi:predicted metalloprotease with PDZ domain
MNGVGERDLVDEKKRKQWAAYLLPHEFTHSWCGKYRRPEGLMTKNYHTPEKTAMLWVYEGLTQYLGEVLTVRCGLLNSEEYMERFSSKVSSLMHITGRDWRPLEDTAVASHLLRGKSNFWSQLRRSQDYYNEGLVIWLQADAIIRSKTDGRKSLDDFCRRFFGPNDSKDRAVGYTLDQLAADLNAVAEYDWKDFLSKRVGSTFHDLPMEFIGQIGYRAQYAATPGKAQESDEKEDASLDATDSLGLRFAKDGSVTAVVPGMSGDKKGVSPEMQVIGVNGRKFSRTRMKDAIADSVAERKIDLLVMDGDRYRTITLDYADGPRYLTIIRDPAKPDVLGAILKSTGK